MYTTVHVRLPLVIYCVLKYALHAEVEEAHEALRLSRRQQILKAKIAEGSVFKDDVTSTGLSAADWRVEVAALDLD